MSDSEEQEVLLMAIEYLKIQYGSLQNPCIALYISRYYRLLSLLDIAKSKQERYAEHSKSWLARHTANPRYSHDMQNQLNDSIQLCEPNSLTL
jgi:hypothetical protein